MTNREKLKTVLLHPGLPNLMKSELNHFMEVDREDPDPGETPYDIVDAFDDVTRFAENNRDNNLLKMCRKIEIAVGQCVPMSQKDIDNTVVTSGTPWDFKLNGIPYVYVWGWMDK